ncbi:MAG: hypothetical protein V1806_18220 [Pseudomonadota bacterium]
MLPIEGEIPGMIPKSALAEILNQNIALARERDELADKARQLESLGDLQEVRAALEAARAARDQQLLEAGQAEDMIRERLAPAKQKHEATLAQLRAERERLTRQATTLQDRLASEVVGRAVLDALASRLGGRVPRAAAGLAAVEAAEMMTVNSEGEVIYKATELPYAPEQFVAQFLDTYGRDWPVPSGPAKGHPLAAGGNPWAPGPGYNLTEQGRLIRTDPERARRLAAAAGCPMP